MSPERDDPNEDQEQEAYEEEAPRSIFAATWFRAVLVLIVLGVIGAVAVPYILDAVNPPAPKQAAVRQETTAPALAPLPAEPTADKPAATGDGAMIPAPPPAPAAPAPAAPAPAAPVAPTPEPPKSAVRDAPPPAPPVAKAEPPAARPEPPAPKVVAPAAKRAAPAARRDVARASETTEPREAKPRAAGKTKAEPRAVAKATTPAAPAAAGPYWVQVGAFRDEEAAKRLAATLREQNFKVAAVDARAPVAPAPPPAPATPSTAAPSAGADQYDVHVSGMSTAELNTKLAAKGLAAQTTSGGVVIKPSLPLRDAVALSKDLAVEGFKVQVRRAGGGDAAPARPAARAQASADKTADSGDALYRVRVGSFADRAAALTALRELEAKGYKPFIARGER